MRGAPGAWDNSIAIAATTPANAAPPAKRNGSITMKNAPNSRGRSSASYIGEICGPNGLPFKGPHSSSTIMARP
ncbi:hypothetical protein G6F56_014598 [Rhizopus delemar]|nr:hypothetical protein G6F56_014598 [Rhizopus delemar]